MPSLYCDNVTMSYHGVPVISHVTFDVQQGDYLCIVGENGSGKTTLMKGILGLLKADQGSFTFNDIKQQEIGYLPQQTLVQRDFPASVKEVVLSGCLNQVGMLPFYTLAQKKTARENIDRLGLTEIRKKSYRTLSGGQQQRVLLARALCAAKSMLLLDEPVTGLDPVMTQEMYEIIRNLNRQGMTIIMISHDIQSAVRYGNKILHVSKEPLFYGSTRDYVRSDIGQRMTGGKEYA